MSLNQTPDMDDNLFTPGEKKNTKKKGLKPIWNQKLQAESGSSEDEESDSDDDQNQVISDQPTVQYQFKFDDDAPLGWWSALKVVVRYLSNQMTKHQGAFKIGILTVFLTVMVITFL